MKPKTKDRILLIFQAIYLLSITMGAGAMAYVITHFKN
jgi:hypothetical protein